MPLRPLPKPWPRPWPPPAPPPPVPYTQSSYFGGLGPAVPHLARSSHGLSGELTDLRRDVEKALLAFQNDASTLLPTNPYLGQVWWDDNVGALMVWEGAQWVDCVSSLASAATGRGAARIGVEDAGRHYAGTTVEAVLAEVATTKWSNPLVQVLTGALSAVTDPAAKDVLTSIVQALTNLGLATGSTT